MATLNEKHKSFIVMSLACYEPPVKVQEVVQERFGVEVSLSQLTYYNPKSLQGSDQLAQKWKDLFDETRRRFLEEITDIPISQKVYRLKKLQENLDNFERIKNYKGINECLEQAAKEVGGAFTNKREHDVSGLIKSINMAELTDNQLKRISDGEHPLTVLGTESES
ncbi:MAG: DUF2280 domain-containing protein [Gracilimonas sp.]|uniref:DUF2280 domain-containing protein n=1 Tax=Gracilimonas sp. TaxID=1974203 RepID=UPI0019B2050D|nr:DUF2280 domain-containing protein [Gracilimonas sp.]MBD3616655.1 DUF2280 domain-containing protein [Gracilimonas sp.]